MEEFDFDYHQCTIQYPESGSRLQLGNSWMFTAAPTAPDQRTLTLSFPGMRVYWDRIAGVPSVLVNGGFDTDLTGWAPDVGTIITSVVDGKLSYNRNNAAFAISQIRQTFATQTGKTYRVQADVSSNSHAAVFFVNGVQRLLFTQNAGRIVFTFTATSASTQLSIGGTNSTLATFFLDNVQVIRYDDDLSANPKLDIWRLEQFYLRHRMWKRFNYYHSQHGMLVVTFNKPFASPKKTENVSGFVEPFELEFLEHP